MKAIRTYEQFNIRRYSTPWVAIVNPRTGKPDFSRQVGGYTGGRNSGEAGELYIINPKEGAVYMYGQKDYRGNNTTREYVQYINGKFVPVSTKKLVVTLSTASWYD